MSEPKELKVLVFTMKQGLRTHIRDFLEGKTIRLTFSSAKEPSKTPKRTLRQYDSYCIATDLESSGVTLCIQAFPKVDRRLREKRSKKRGVKRKTKRQ